MIDTMDIMISYITGIITHLSEQQIVISTEPIGLAIQVPTTSTFQLNQKITLQLYLHWNQEQGPTLYGFITEIEKHLFELIISCSGIGPRIALALLAQLAPVEFVRAIQSGNERVLSTVNGIGLKKAEQMIVQLKHKITKLLDTGIDLGAHGNTLQHRQQIVQVLKSLNYSRTEIHGALAHLNEKHIDPTMPFDHLMRQALAFLAKKI